MDKQDVKEKLTRKKWIDGKLKNAGWTTIVPFSEQLDLASLHKTAVEELPQSILAKAFIDRLNIERFPALKAMWGE